VYVSTLYQMSTLYHINSYVRTCPSFIKCLPFTTLTHVYVYVSILYQMSTLYHINSCTYVQPLSNVYPLPGVVSLSLHHIDSRDNLRGFNVPQFTSFVPRGCQYLFAVRSKGQLNTNKQEQVVRKILRASD
jgi:hypothetical protein